MSAPLVSIFNAQGYTGCMEQATRLLRDGGLVVLPTETVYGIAARLDLPDTLMRLKALRGGLLDRPFTPHLGGYEQAAGYIDPPGDFERRMMKKLWPGPVALVFDVSESRRIQRVAESGIDATEIYARGAVTLRCPGHAVALHVLGAVDAPIAMVAADHGGDTLDSPAHRLAEELDGRVDLVVDAGPTRYGKPSTVLQVTGDSYRIVREGVYDARIIDKLLKTTLLFVCSGNTCRSAMAEGLARKILMDRLHVSADELGRRGIHVMSAGSFAMGGAPAATHAVEVLREQGADLSRHRSSPLSVEMIHEADHIYTMSDDHSQAVAALVPSAMERVTPLDPEGDIADPVGADIETYRRVAARLKSLIERRLDELAVI